jgi:hypothetical protein
VFSSFSAKYLKLGKYLDLFEHPLVPLKSALFVLNNSRRNHSASPCIVFLIQQFKITEQRQQLSVSDFNQEGVLMNGSDLVKLLALLAVVAAIAAGAYWWGQSQGDTTKKYSHPVSRQGTKW